MKRKLNSVLLLSLLAFAEHEIFVSTASATNIQYGVIKSVKKTLPAGTISCGNSTFGDPAFGVAKHCYIDGKKIADEGGKFNLTSKSVVEFGINTKILKIFSWNSIVGCNNATFGDPVPGIAKECFIEEKVIAKENETIRVSSPSQLIDKDAYGYISDGKLMAGNNPVYLSSVNYGVDLRYRPNTDADGNWSDSSDSYFFGPSVNQFAYTNGKNKIDDKSGSNGSFIGCSTEKSCAEAIRKDLIEIKAMGFNSVRLYGAGAGCSSTTTAGTSKCQEAKSSDWTSGSRFPLSTNMQCFNRNGSGWNYGDNVANCNITNSKFSNSPLNFDKPDAFFNILDKLFRVFYQEQIKIILLASGQIWDNNNSNLYIPGNGTVYRALTVEYLQKFGKRFQDEPSLFAYDLLNEPGWSAAVLKDKKDTLDFTQLWYDAIRTYDKNHLVTIGLTNIETSYNYHFDPALIAVDFPSFHPYQDGKLSVAERKKPMQEESFITDQWMSALKKPWIIGEQGAVIGVSFKNSQCRDNAENKIRSDGHGNDKDQADWLNVSFKSARACHASGFQWWTYSGVWGCNGIWGLGVMKAKLDTTSQFSNFNWSYKRRKSGELAVVLNAPTQIYDSENDVCAEPYSYGQDQNSPWSIRGKVILSTTLKGVPYARIVITDHTDYDKKYVTFSSANGEYYQPFDSRHDVSVNAIAPGTEAVSINVKWQYDWSHLRWSTNSTQIILTPVSWAPKLSTPSKASSSLKRTKQPD